MKIYEKYFKKSDDGLETEAIINKKEEPFILECRCLKRNIYIQKWILFLWILANAFLFSILIAAVVIFFCAPRPGLYLESCKRRSCAKELNLKCIDNICKCKDNQYYLNKCNDKKTSSEICKAKFECASNLNCTDGKCKCSDLQYWNNNECKAVKTYQEPCSENQCKLSSFLYCNKFFGVCTCQQGRFWDGEICVKKRLHKERCEKSEHCDETLSLACNTFSKVCECPDYSLYFYNGFTLSCKPRAGYYKKFN